MSIKTIENSIITQLQNNVSDLKIEGFPDKPADYQLLHSKGAVLVHFQGATYNEPEETVFTQQDVTLEFGITLLIKGLRDKNGAYTYIDTIISTLTGYSPTGCNKMYPVKVDFLAEKEGIWQYTLSFSVPTENFS